MQEDVYHTQIHDVGLDNLKECLLDVWATLDQRIIDKNLVNLNFGR